LQNHQRKPIYAHAMPNAPRIYKDPYEIQSTIPPFFPIISSVIKNPKLVKFIVFVVKRHLYVNGCLQTNMRLFTSDLIHQAHD
jgi:hypothetical protein